MQVKGTWFRRKTRVVSCGNFQKKSQDEVNYSGGAAAEGVRLMIAAGSRRRWCIINGDVTSAFLRALVPNGVHLAINPPSVLVRAGLCEPDELWIALAAVYGFRSSPRWWSSYRTDMMKKAVTKIGMKFDQGTADPNIWKVLNEKGELQGLIAVYVDDYLVTGPKEICEDVHEWFSTTWQTTEIQYATPENSIRFLGMEISAIEDNDGTLVGSSLDQEGCVQELIRQYELDERQMSTIPSVKEWMSLGVLRGEGPQGRPVHHGRASVAGSTLSARLGLHSECDGFNDEQGPKKGCSGGNEDARLPESYEGMETTVSCCPSLVVYTDSSYAPDGGRSHGRAVVFWSGAPVAFKANAHYDLQCRDGASGGKRGNDPYGLD